MTIDLTDDRNARIALSYATRRCDPTTRAILIRYTPAETIDIASRGQTPRGVTRAAFEEWQANVSPRLDPALAESLVARTEQGGFTPLTPRDPAWQLTGLADLGTAQPLVLWEHGAGSLIMTKRTDRIAISGARAATGYGVHQAGKISGELAERERVIIAGAAYGIDAAAHRATLAMGGYTIAVLAGGVDRPYPASHTALLERIAETGLVVSEQPPGAAPSKQRFADRHRIIAALAASAIIVEAGPHSGALHLADAARRLGRPVGAVPGPVTSVVSTGSNQLIHDGKAQLVSDARQVIELTEGPQPDSAGTDLAAPREHPDLSQAVVGAPVIEQNPRGLGV